eukprot:288865-Amphidinium_carterae.1
MVLPSCRLAVYFRHAWEDKATCYSSSESTFNCGRASFYVVGKVDPYSSRGCPDGLYSVDLSIALPQDLGDGQTASLMIVP